VNFDFQQRREQAVVRGVRERHRAERSAGQHGVVQVRAQRIHGAMHRRAKLFWLQDVLYVSVDQNRSVWGTQHVSDGERIGFRRCLQHCR